MSSAITVRNMTTKKADAMFDDEATAFKIVTQAHGYLDAGKLDAPEPVKGFHETNRNCLKHLAAKLDASDEVKSKLTKAAAIFDRLHFGVDVLADEVAESVEFLAESLG